MDRRDSETERRSLRRDQPQTAKSAALMATESAESAALMATESAESAGLMATESAESAALMATESAKSAGLMATESAKSAGLMATESAESADFMEPKSESAESADVMAPTSETAEPSDLTRPSCVKPASPADDAGSTVAPSVVRRLRRAATRRRSRMHDTIEITMVAVDDADTPDGVTADAPVDHASDVARVNWLRLRRRWHGYTRLSRRPTSDELDGAAATRTPRVFQFQVPHDAQFYFQHPYARLAVVTVVTVLNFIVYAEDPTSHSRRPCAIPVIGHSYNFLFPPYPPALWAILKVVILLAALVSAVLLGKVVVHQLLFQRFLKLEMFSEDKGSWLVMLFTAFLTLFAAAQFFNLLVFANAAPPHYCITATMNMSDSFYAKLAMCGTWMGNFLTVFVVTDMMLQEKMLYAGWCAPVRTWWTTGYNRIVVFWTVVLIVTALGITAVICELVSWDWLTGGLIYSDELTRALLASLILVCDLLVVMQDWDFPHFINSLEIKLPGFNFNDFVFEMPNLFHPKKWYKIHMTGKWLNYGMVFLVMLLDVNMWKNQVFYTPSRYDQYVGPHRRIHTAGALPPAPSGGTNSQLSYEWRASHVDPATNASWFAGDAPMNSRFNDHGVWLTALAILPSVAGLVAFGALVWHFGRRTSPTLDEPRRGRLIRRRTVRFSQRHRRASPTLTNPWGLDLTALLKEVAASAVTPERARGARSPDRDATRGEVNGATTNGEKFRQLVAGGIMKSAGRDEAALVDRARPPVDRRPLTHDVAKTTVGGARPLQKQVSFGVRDGVDVVDQRS